MRITTLLTLMLTLVLGRAFAQTPPVPQNPAAPPEAKKDEPAKEEKKDTFLFIKNCDLYPVSGPAVRGVGILIKNRTIEQIGENIDVPKDAETIDATGLRAYPGMIALNGSGILAGQTKDGTNPLGLLNVMGLAHGITTILQGQAAMKLTYGTVEDQVLRDNLFIGLFYNSQNPRGKQQLRSELTKAREYLRAVADAAQKRAQGDASAKDPDQRALGGAARYLPLLRGELPAVFNVQTAPDLLQVVELVKDYGFKTIVRGAYEGWVCADQLGRAGIAAVITPRNPIPQMAPHTPPDSDPTYNRPNGTSIENAAILHKAGVKVAVCTQKSAIDLDGQAGQDAFALATEAGMAMRGGLPADAALESVTITAARLFGLDDRIGSIEVGKDADIVITDGELLHYATMVQYAVVNGKIAYDKAKESLYRNIRPRTEVPSSDAGWPRRFAPMPDEWKYDPAEEAKKKAAATSQPASQPTSQPASQPSGPEGGAPGPRGSRGFRRGPGGPGGEGRRGDGPRPEGGPESQPTSRP